MNQRIKYCHAVTAALAAMLFTGGAAAATGSAAVEAEYRQEVARCTSGQSNEDRATCLREAGAARQAARQGNLTSATPDDYQRNQLRRCDALPASEKEACIARMEKGTVSGSVDGGGILREYREYVPAQAPR